MDRVRFCTKKTTRLASGFLSGCQKSPRTFPTACKNAVTFPPRSGGKVLAALAERLAVQGIRGIRSHSRRAAAPSSSPAKTEASSTQQRFFDKLTGLLQNRILKKQAKEKVSENRRAGGCR